MSVHIVRTLLLGVAVVYVLVIPGLLWWLRREWRASEARLAELQQYARVQLKRNHRDSMQTLELRRYVFSLGKGNAKNAWLN